jgi:protein-disulfide isomerase
MASRKEQKEEARQARLAAEQAAAARAARTRRLGMIGGVVVVAVIVVVVAIVVSSGGGSKAKNTSAGLATGTKASATYDAVATELKGIPQSGTVLGKASAPVTIQYFGDLECPVCQEFSLGENGGGLPQFITGPVKQGKAKLDYKSMETASAAVNSDRFVPQQVAAYAAGKQGLFWDYAELFYHEQGSEDDRYVTEDYLQGLAKQIPTLNLTQWTTDRKDAALTSQVSADGKLATTDGLQGTPTLVAIGPKPKGGGQAKEEIVQAATGIPTYSEIMSAVSAVS